MKGRRPPPLLQSRLGMRASCLVALVQDTVAQDFAWINDKFEGMVLWVSTDDPWANGPLTWNWRLCVVIGSHRQCIVNGHSALAYVFLRLSLLGFSFPCQNTTSHLSHIQIVCPQLWFVVCFVASVFVFTALSWMMGLNQVPERQNRRSTNKARARREPQTLCLGEAATAANALPASSGSTFVWSHVLLLLNLIDCGSDRQIGIEDFTWAQYITHTRGNTCGHVCVRLSISWMRHRFHFRASSASHDVRAFVRATAQNGGFLFLISPLIRTQWPIPIFQSTHCEHNLRRLLETFSYGSLGVPYSYSSLYVHVCVCSIFPNPSMMAVIVSRTGIKRGGMFLCLQALHTTSTRHEHSPHILNIVLAMAIWQTSGHMPIQRKNFWEIESSRGLPYNNSMTVEHDIQHISNLSSSKHSMFHGHSHSRSQRGHLSGFWGEMC